MRPAVLRPPGPPGDAIHAQGGPAADCLGALRDATRTRHERLDAALPIARPGATLDDYIRHASALAAWLQALSPLLRVLDDGASAWPLDDPARRNALRDDLTDAAAAPSPCAAPGAGAAIDAAFAAFPGRHAAVAWGMAYVVEGSQLGGQWLYRRLARPLAPHPLRYLQGSGARTAERWKDFTARLARNVRTPSDIEAACAGACAAFDALQRQYDPLEMPA
ncbi:heme oxygenase [Paracidovorax citrulli]|uniref:Heme oxygenase n=1 Tax=Paracidovorax citrulli (strain AAC00-1) TaxID=397945 RepID=A1TRF6_PARC0|nr:Heme oxygenase [Paracidovorax citrulli AAC00-1]ATG94158.1 heme oxygenase [Paracidovorax citrulli]MVT28243.1 heme oxygenase [Paracidovorax citrulli]PVY62970.1 heme oxygenase [Paracidovorax citrulli]REG68046.1 heme oxygenase [Paracidovorax citrulli]